jgi:phage antirepressor YoqD-like protein
VQPRLDESLTGSVSHEMSTSDLSAAMPGRHRIGTVAGFGLECWPTSRRNSGRLPVGISGRLRRNTQIAGYAHQIIELKGQVSVLAPKAAALDYLGNCKGSLNLRNAAKALKMSPGWFNNRLQQMEILHVSDGRLVAYQKFVDAGWFIHKPVAVTHTDGGREIINQPRVTGRGLAKLAVRLGVGVHAVLGQGVLDLGDGDSGSLH